MSSVTRKSICSNCLDSHQTRRRDRAATIPPELGSIRGSLGPARSSADTDGAHTPRRAGPQVRRLRLDAQWRCGAEAWYPNWNTQEVELKGADRRSGSTLSRTVVVYQVSSVIEFEQREGRPALVPQCKRRKGRRAVPIATKQFKPTGLAGCKWDRRSKQALFEASRGRSKDRLRVRRVYRFASVEAAKAAFLHSRRRLSVERSAMRLIWMHRLQPRRTQTL